MGEIQDHNAFPQPVEDLWAIDWRLGSVVQADCHHAEGVKDKDDVVLWLSRETLNEDQRAKFLQHLERLMSVRDWGHVEGGVDAAQRGFVVLSHGSTKAIDFDAPGVVATRNRFLMCVVLISQIHEAGFACGNITPGSFAVDSFGSVRLIGFMGGYEEKITPTIPLDIRPFFRVNGDLVGVPSDSADVYSLAVMGLTLFGAQFPPAAIDVKNMDEYLERVNADAPPWVLSVLATIVREPQRQFCSNATEMLRAIAAKDQEYFGTLLQAIEERTIESEGEKPLSIDEIHEMFITPEQRRKKRINALIHSKALKGAVFGVVGLLVLLVVVLQASNLRAILPAQMTSRGKAVQAGSTLNDVKEALTLLKGDGGVSAQTGGISGSAKGDRHEAAPIATGDVRAAADVATPKKITIEADNTVIGYLERGDISPEERTMLFDLYGECDDESKSRLAATVVKIGGDSEREFRTMLIKQLQRSALMEQEALEKLSTDALFIAAEGRLSKRAAGVWGRLDALSNDELWWLLRVHVRKRSPVFQLLSSVVVKRHLTSPSKEMFFSVAAAADENSGAPYDALFRGGTEGVTASDVQRLNGWADPLAARAMIAVLLSTSDPAMVEASIAGIAAKPEVDTLVSATIEALSSAEGYEPAKVGKLIGALGMGDDASEEMLRQGFESLKGSPAQSSVVALALQRGSPQIVEIALRMFGKDMHPDLLIQLLDRPEASIRKAAIPFLKEVQLSSSKARIRGRYETEQDTEVRRLFEVELYSK
jgi:hypothetical protein